MIWGEILTGLNIDAAGGQKRRLGRFLFAMSARRFRDSVVSIVRDMQSRGERSTELTIHIFCGLAGGTGSGSVIDAVAQLRVLYPDPRTRIIVYAYLPDLNPPNRWNTGNYHANAYAALLELNAMSVGAWAPFDVLGGGGPVQNPDALWFNGCYVFSDENAQGYRAAVDKDLPDLLAEFVYNKTVVARQVNWQQLTSMENSENGDAAPEKTTASGQGQRSLRFMSFGIRSVAFPEETIREFLSYDFVMQSLNQLRFNNWQDGFGYLEQPRPRADAEFVADPKQRESWRLTDDYLRLSRPIIDIDSTKRWTGYDEEWKEWQNHYLRLAQQGDKLKWLNELIKLFQNTWATGFRGLGVEAFFKTADRDRRNYALSIRNRVEETLFETWRTGSRSLSECGRIVDALIEDLTIRYSRVDDWIQKRAEASKLLQAQFADVEKRWGQLRLLPGTRERELDSASFLLREDYTARTLAESGRFAKRLMEELLTQLQDLRAAVSAAENAIALVTDQAKAIVEARRPGRAATAQQEGSYVTALETAGQVEAVRRKLTLNEDEMRTHTATVRARIATALGQQTSFSAFTRRFNEADIRNILIATSEEDVASAHQRLVTQRSERVVGVSVIDKLRDQWGDNSDRINRETLQLVQSAGRFVVFDEAEQNRSFPGRHGGPRAVESFAVMMPMPAEHESFVKLLQAGFRNARAGGDVTFISSGERANSLTLVSLVNLFPLRFVRLIRALKARYDERLQGQGRERAILEIHTEGGPDTFPDLYVLARASLATKFRPLLLLGLATGALEQDPAARGAITLTVRDADGFVAQRIQLGQTLLEATEDVSEDTVELLRKATGPRLPTDRSEVALAPARDIVVAAVSQATSAIAAGPSDPEFAAWNTAGREAMKVLRGETSL